MSHGPFEERELRMAKNLSSDNRMIENLGVLFVCFYENLGF